MKFRPTHRPFSTKRACAGFTLAEVLAALVLMAIVIPVAVEGVQLASRAGSVGERKAAAARIADTVLNEIIVTRQWQQASQQGAVQEGAQTYQWQMKLEPWSEDSVMRLLTIQVSVPVQGKDYDVKLSTLVDASQ